MDKNLKTVLGNNSAEKKLKLGRGCGRVGNEFMWPWLK